MTQSEDTPLKTKRLNLIRAAQDLGINKESFCNFLLSAIEVEESSLKLFGAEMSNTQRWERETALLEARLVHIIFKEF